jgi:hypothetical protein
MDETAEPTAQVTQPILVDLGRQKSKRIKALKKGEGQPNL